MEKQKKTIKISLKNSILLFILFSVITILLCVFIHKLISNNKLSHDKDQLLNEEVENNTYDVMKVNLVNKSNDNSINWKNDTAYIIVKKVTYRDVTQSNNYNDYSIVLVSTEFFENFYNYSFYDKENQIFYFNNSDTYSKSYVKGYDSYYHENNQEFSLVQNINVSTEIIDGRLFIPIPIYRNDFALNHLLGYDEDNQNIYYYGPTYIYNKEFPSIDDVTIKEEINHLNYYYNSEKYKQDMYWSTLEYMKYNIDGHNNYYSATVNGENCIIKVNYQYDGNRYIYNNYSIVSKIADGNVIKKVDESGKYFVIEKNGKYGVRDAVGTSILDTEYDSIETYENTDYYYYINDTTTYYGYDNSYRLNLKGIIVKLKRNNKYTLYSLDNKTNILNNQWFKDINIGTNINIDTNLRDADNIVKMTCIYSDEGMGLIIDNNLFTDAIYDKIEIIEIRSINSIYKLYKNNEIFIIAPDGNDEYFNKFGENFYISKKGYKKINYSTKYDNLTEKYSILDVETGEKILEGNTGGMIVY